MGGLKQMFFLALISVYTLKAEVPFTRGVNLTEWFQVSGAGEIQYTKFSRKDILDIKSLGCDAIRLPINLHAMTSGSPDYHLDPLFLTFLDSVVDWCTQADMHLVLDNHTFDPAVSTPANIEDPLIKVWTQMASHYANAYDKLYYEVLNEPHGISDDVWGTIQGNVIDAIREYDVSHTIVVGPASWNSYNNLQYMPEYSDNNLLYTFHFYDPFLFTHQGASWTDPSMATLAGVPFPYSSEMMPVLPPELENTWIEDSFNDYSNQGTADKVKELMDIAIAFRDERNVPLWCGEFGVYIPNSNPQERANWYDTVSTYMDKNNIAWTTWDYTGGFGLFEAGGNDMFEYDLDTSILAALHLNIPDQSDFVVEPDSNGFLIYSDYIAGSIISENYASGSVVSFYSNEFPNNDSYCISWEDGNQYSRLGFRFRPYKDLSYLVENNYALDLIVRGSVCSLKLDIRFLDTKTGPDDHPWRMRYVLDDSNIKWDGNWYHLFIPLSDFIEQGSWDNDTWHNPEGLFDWSAVQDLEIVAEQNDINGEKFWFDNIHITNMDTARIFETGTYTPLDLASMLQYSEFTITPNPVFEQAKISYKLNEPAIIKLSIFNTLGQEVAVIEQGYFDAGAYTSSWHIPPNQRNGVFYARLITGENSTTIKKFAVMR